MIWAFASATLIIPACVNVYQYLSQASFNSIFVFGLFSIANAAIAYQERGTFRVANFYSKSGKPLTIWARGPDAERFDDFVVLVTNRVERMKSARQGNMT